MAQPGGGSVDHGREPCPDRILDDIGGAFGMGAVGGGIWHLIKGAKNSPSGARTRGGIEVTLKWHAEVGTDVIKNSRGANSRHRGGAYSSSSPLDLTVVISESQACL